MLEGCVKALAGEGDGLAGRAEARARTENGESIFPLYPISDAKKENQRKEKGASQISRARPQSEHLIRLRLYTQCFNCRHPLCYIIKMIESIWYKKIVTCCT